MADKRAWLMVPASFDDDDDVPLPPGFREVWSCEAETDVFAQHLLIEGPFPDEVTDCGDVVAELSVGNPTSILYWQWVDAKTLEPIGEKVVLDG